MERFDKALAFVATHKTAPGLTQAVQLELYGLFKQATVGRAADASVRPSAWDLVGRAKFDAWLALGELGADEARTAYCAVLDRVFPGWDAGVAAAAAPRKVGAALFEDDGARAARTTPHAFWDAQPMPNKWSDDDDDSASAPPPPPPPPEMIDNQIAANVSPEPLALPAHLQWCDDEWAAAPLAQVCEAVQALARACAEGGAMAFMPDVAFLQWSMSPPAMKREWLVGFREKDTRALVGFICGLPCTVSVHGVLVERTMEIKNLYVHPSLRGARLAPVLIGEISRRVRQSDYCVALYTSSVTITRPLTQARYYQRPLNYAKLVAARYKDVPRGHTLSRLQQRYSVPSSSSSLSSAAMPRGWRRLDGANGDECAAALRLFNAHQSRFALHQRMGAAEFAHWFARGPPAMHAYVCGGHHGERLTGFCSWYVLEARVPAAGCGAALTVHGAFMHYACVRVHDDDDRDDDDDDDDDDCDGVSLADVLEAGVAQAARAGADVALMLDVGGSEDYLLQFARSRAEATAEPLLYHLYNFRCRPCDVDQMNIHFL